MREFELWRVTKGHLTTVRREVLKKISLATGRQNRKLLGVIPMKNDKCTN